MNRWKFLMIIILTSVGCWPDFSGFSGNDFGQSDLLNVDAADDPSDLNTDGRFIDLQSVDFTIEHLPDLSCPQGQTLCSSGCTDTRSDPQNCGRCAVVCGQGGTLDIWCFQSICDVRAPYESVCNDNKNCQSGYCSSPIKGGKFDTKMICTNRDPGDPCGVNGDCKSQNCSMGVCQ